MLVDGSDQSQDRAGSAVDSFLSAHAVLEVAWEPIYPNEPSWWILMPRAKGMPGHLFAMIDALQWQHPMVAKAEEYHHKSNRDCTRDKQGVEHCVPGCPGTLTKRFIASGYNADTEWVTLPLRKALTLNIPYQVSPVRLGIRGVPPKWDHTLGWSYTYAGCESHFLDCFFLHHSPCPRIDIEPVEGPGHNKVDKMRYKDRHVSVPGNAPWFANAVGMGHKDLPQHAVGELHGQPATHVFYSYIFRPNFRTRRDVNRRVEAFNIKPDSCTIMHVRRGDSVMHRGQGRAYISIEAYVRAGRVMMDALGVKTILLFTDSVRAIEEALRCEQEFPDVCGGIRWRYVDKKRWIGAEGGWENPFPSGNATEELMVIQSEFALTQKCSMAIVGESGYGNLMLRYQCCGFPMSPRGVAPRQCVCPPSVRVHQGNYNCDTGNKLLCSNADIGGNIHLPLFTPSNMLGANFSFTKDAFRDDPEIEYQVPDLPDLRVKLSELKSGSQQPRVSKYMQDTVLYVCKYRRNPDGNYSFCPPLAAAR